MARVVEERVVEEPRERVVETREPAPRTSGLGTIIAVIIGLLILLFILSRFISFGGSGSEGTSTDTTTNNVELNSPNPATE